MTHHHRVRLHPKQAVIAVLAAIRIQLSHPSRTRRLLRLRQPAKSDRNEMLMETIERQLI